MFEVLGRIVILACMLRRVSGAQNADYMSGSASSVSANDFKYGGGATSQQQQLGPQSAAAAIGAYASRNSSGAAGGMGNNASNKTNLYGKQHL